MPNINHHGTVDANKVYTETELRKIVSKSGEKPLSVHLFQDHYYKRGLLFFQPSRQGQERLIAGSEFLRFVERESQSWNTTSE